MSHRSNVGIPRALALATAMGIAGCGGVGAPAQTSTSGEAATTGAEPSHTGGYGADMQVSSLSGEEQQVVATWPEEVMSLEQELGDALELATVDCGRARELRDRICDLAERICQISGRHPEDGEVRERCSDGRSRCERATGSVGGSCE